MSLLVTPETRKWIASRTLAGASVGVLLQELVSSGWPYASAVIALEAALLDRRESLLPAITAPLPSLFAPEPDLSRAPVTVDVGDREVQILCSMSTPRLVLIGGFLSDAECDQLIDLAEPRLAVSTVVDYSTGGSIVSDARTSMGMSYGKAETELVARIETRIHRFIRWPLENGESIQVMKYYPGTQFVPHTDFFDPKQSSSDVLFAHGGQRVATFLMYLKSPTCGGETVFTDAGLTIAPQKGAAVFFSYAEANASSKTQHGGAPVLLGEKWIATRWLRERAIPDWAPPVTIE